MSGSELFGHGDQVQHSTWPESDFVDTIPASGYPENTMKRFMIG